MTTILVAEDDAEVRSYIEKMLKGKSFEVIAATSGEEALTLATGNSIDLLLTDGQMGGINGEKLIKILMRADRRDDKNIVKEYFAGDEAAYLGLVQKFIDTPIVFMSSSRDAYGRSSLVVGASAFLEKLPQDKPIPENLLVQTLNGLLNKKRDGNYIHLHHLARDIALFEEGKSFYESIGGHQRGDFYFSFKSGQEIYLATFDFEKPGDINTLKIFRCAFRDLGARGIDFATATPYKTEKDAVAFLKEYKR